MKGLRSYPNPALRQWRFAADVPEPNLWYRLCRRFCQVWFCTLWKVRVFNRHHEPARGSALYISNHQSYLDPMLVGLALRRPMNYMARDDLFNVPIFKQLITSLNAFPVRRGSADTGAVKEALRRLKRGGQVTVFPEGTRTADGTIGPFLPVVSLLARRAAEWVVPVLIDGAFECWPRTQPLPTPGQIVVVYGKPLHREKLRNAEARQFVGDVRRRIIDMQTETRRRLGRPPLKYD